MSAEHIVDLVTFITIQVWVQRKEKSIRVVLQRMNQHWNVQWHGIQVDEIVEYRKNRNGRHFCVMIENQSLHLFFVLWPNEKSESSRLSIQWIFLVSRFEYNDTRN